MDPKAFLLLEVLSGLSCIRFQIADDLFYNLDKAFAVLLYDKPRKYKAIVNIVIRKYYISNDLC
jgi:hypothetical protein